MLDVSEFETVKTKRQKSAGENKTEYYSECAEEAEKKKRTAASRDAHLLV